MFLILVKHSTGSHENKEFVGKGGGKFFLKMKQNSSSMEHLWSTFRKQNCIKANSTERMEMSSQQMQ